MRKGYTVWYTRPERLHLIISGFTTAGGIPGMANTHGSLQSFYMTFLKNIAYQTYSLFYMEAFIAGDYPGSILPAVLKLHQAVIDLCRSRT